MRKSEERESILIKKKKKKKKLRGTEVMQGSKKKGKKRPIHFKICKLIFSKKIYIYWVHGTTVSSFKRSSEETQEHLEFKNIRGKL